MKLTANTPIRHDGEDIDEGEDFEVKDAKKAKALVDQGTARAAGSPESAPPRQGDPNAQTGVAGDGGGTSAAAPAPTTPGPAAGDDRGVGKKAPFKA